MPHLKPLLLIAILVLVQSGLLVHQSDIQAHQADDHCEVCLHGMSLGHGVASTPFILASEAGTPPLSFADHPLSSSTQFFVYSARAPPVTFSS